MKVSVHPHFKDYKLGFLDLLLSFGDDRTAKENLLTFAEQFYSITSPTDFCFSFGQSCYTYKYDKKALKQESNGFCELLLNHEPGLIEDKKLLRSLHVSKDEYSYFFAFGPGSTIMCSFANKLDLEEEKIISETCKKYGILLKARKTVSDINITSLEEEANKLEEREALLDSILNSSHDSVVAFDKSYKVIAFNQHARARLKNTPNAKIGMHFQDILGKKKFEALVSEHLNFVLEGESRYFQNVTKDEKFFHISLHPLKSKDGETTGFIEVSRDITDLSLQNRNLAQSKALLQSVLDSAGAGIYAINQDLEIIAINKQAVADFKREVNIDLQLGDSLKNVVDEKTLKRWQDTYFDQVFKGSSLNYTGANINNKEFVSNDYSPVKDEDGKIIGCLEISQNITERVEFEKKLVRKEADYKSVVNSTPTGIAKLDPEGQFLYMNNRAKKIILPSNVSSTSLADILAEEDNDLFRKKIHEVQITKSEREITLKISTQKGIKIIQGILSYLDDQKNENASLLFAFNDVTEQHIAKDRLTESESTLKAIIENSPDSILFVDRNMVVKMINNVAERTIKKMDGSSIQVGEKFMQRTDSEHQLVFKLLKEALDGNSRIVELEQKHGDKLKFFELIFQPVYDINNEIIGAMSIGKDISNLKNKELELVKSEQKYRGIIENSPSGISIIAKDGTNLFLSPRSAEIHGYTQEQRIGQSSFALIHEDFADEAALFLKKVLEDGETVKATIKTKHIDGHTVWIEGIASPVFDDKGQPDAFYFIYNDVTQQIEAEKTIEESQRKLVATQRLYATMYENMFDAIFIYDLDAEQIIDCNTAAQELMELDKDELKKLKFSNLIPEKSLHFPGENLRGKFDSVKKELSSTRSTTVRLPLNKPNGGELVCVVNMIKTSALNNKVFLIVHNITEETKANIRLENVYKQSKERNAVYEALISNSSDAIDILEIEEKDGTWINPQVIVRNGKMKEIFNHNDDAIVLKEELSKIWNEVQADGKSGEEFYENYMEVLKTKNIIKANWRFKTNEENYRDVRTICQLLNIEDKLILIRNFTDVTQKLKQEKEISKRNKIYESLVANSFDAIDIIEYDINEQGNASENGRVLARNENMHALLQDPQKCYDKIEHYEGLLPETQFNGTNSEDLFKDVIVQVLKFGGSQDEIQMILNGKVCDFETSHLFREIEGNFYLLRNFRNISERKKQQEIIANQIETLNEKNDELEKYIDSNLQLENFAYIASHDLKAPLRTVSSFAYLLKQKAYEGLDDKSKGFLDIVLKSSNSMQLLIDDLLAFSRVNTQKLKFVSLDFQEILKRIILQLNTSIVETNAQIHIDKMPPEVIADESMMIQIFQNLLNNAIKFRPENKNPHIEVKVKELDKYWQFTVSDNGIGIKKESQAKIFQIFEKLHSNDTFEGTGLGLTICKKIVEHHEGQIWVESEEGVGSTFYFTLSKNLSVNELNA